MNTRLKQFLAAENITQAQFADTINVVRASVSHILSGRNNPSFDFIKAMMTHYPNLNIEWLMFGKGKMYKDAGKNDAGALFTEEPARQIQPADSFPLQEEHAAVTISDTPEPVLPMNEFKTLDKGIQIPTNQRKAIKIIVMYDDGSYQEL